MNIVFIQLDWPLQECLISLLSPLSDAGANIYVFYNSKSDFIDESRITSTRATFLSLSEQRTARSSLLWAAGKAASLAVKKLGLSTAWASIFEDYADFSVHFNSKKIERLCKESRIIPDLIIGVEKKGTIVADRVSKRLRAKLAYYCIELYYGDSGHHISRATFLLESRALANASHIIIQDSDRYDYLARHMPIQNATASLIPVSAEPTFIQNSNTDYQILESVKKLKKEGRFLFLYSGMAFHCKNLCTLIKEWQNHSNSQAHLLLHIHDKKSMIRDLKKLAQRTANISVIEEMLTSHCHQELIKSCDAGIAFYTGNNANSLLIARSSQKVANYLMYGKPILAYENRSFKGLFSVYRCGEMVRADLGNLMQKSEAIIDRYSFYASMAGEAFEAIYSASTNASRLYSELTSLVIPRQGIDPANTTQ